MPQVFDSLAATYDADFTCTQIGQYLRGRVQARLLHRYSAGDHILELGCGTGEDALLLANHGINVTATDASPAMLDQARHKASGHPLLTFARLDLSDLPDERPSSRYDGAFASFGPVNCIGDWCPLAAWLADQVCPGGVVALGVMSPFCLWEMVWHSLHLNFRTAFRRLRADVTFGGQPIHYPTVRRLTRDFAPHFERVYVRGLGLFLPPSDVYGVIEKRPNAIKVLSGLEVFFTRLGALSMFADHYWIEFRRRDH